MLSPSQRFHIEKEVIVMSNRLIAEEIVYYNGNKFTYDCIFTNGHFQYKLLVAINDILV